ncbi:MAG: MurR/RpiR family transcriptional regulator [Armatimonadota bacterium]
MGVTTRLSVTALIASYLPSLRGAERTVAEFILKSPAAVKGVSITHLGSLCGVSQTTVNRLCCTLGFTGYAEFKLKLVEELAPDTADGSHRGDIDPDDSSTELINKVISIDIAALQSVADLLDIDAFDRAVEALFHANTVEVVGVGSSLPVAMDLYYRFLRTGLNSRFSVDSHMQTINAALLQPKDVLIAVSYSGTSRETIQSTAQAKRAGATTICITNFARTPLSEMCDVVLMTPAKKMQFIHEAITGRLTQYALADALCVAVGRRRGKSVRARQNIIDMAVQARKGE